MKNFLPFLIFTLTIFTGCDKKEISVTVSNFNNENLGQRIVEVNAEEVLPHLGSQYFFITDSKGEIVISQLTYNNKIIFPAEVNPGETEKYFFHPSDSAFSYKTKVFGDFYPQRRDDLSYENDKIGVRIYGPGTQAAGEQAYGYDIFFKYPIDEIVLPQLYHSQTSSDNWEKADSLRKIDPALAEEFIQSFTYHIDHGKGMDCYAVGATLGAGTAALIINDSICYPWCYDKAEILDNGPLRFTARLDFLPQEISEDYTVTEHRLISLDAGSYLNHTKVWYDDLQSATQIVAGFPRRDEAPAIMDAENNIVAYPDPTQGSGNGKALLGIYSTTPVDSIFEKYNHILFSAKINPEDTLVYNWGYAWDRNEIKSLSEWKVYLLSNKYKYNVKLNK